MSEWRKTKKEDMEVDGDEINVWLESNDYGNFYTTIEIKDILELLTPQKPNKFEGERE